MTTLPEDSATFFASKGCWNAARTLHSLLLLPHNLSSLNTLEVLLSSFASQALDRGLHV